MPQDTLTTSPLHTFILSALLCLSLALILPGKSVSADDEVPKETVPVMPEVLVEAERITPTTGTTILDKEIIESLPTRNGSVNELIGIVPGVQYAEGVYDSYSAGEVSPPDVSISGSRFYDNNFTIDGIGNTSLLDPANKLVNGDYKLPGHPQMLFLSPKLIEQVTVYTSNIPAEFGEFSGGQVDAVTLEPASEFHGHFFYRTTNDNLTKVHIHPLNQEAFENTTSEEFQPEFDKHNFGLILNTPVGPNTDMILSYQSLLSEIPLSHLGSSKNQKRRQENLFFKLSHQISNSTRFTLTGLYAPTTYNYFIENFKDSDFTIESGGYLLALAAEHDFSWGVFSAHLGLNSQQSERSAPNVRLSWDLSPSIDWGSTYQGSKGNLETSQQDINFNSELEIHPFTAAGIEHRIKSGIKITHSTQNYNRPEDSLYYYSSNDNNGTPFSCNAGDEACITNEQFLEKLNIYPKVDTTARASTMTAYFQDVFTLGRIEIFPGLRGSYDDVTNNLNFAPRLSTSWDIFGNQKTILFGGLNRYYSGTLLTHKLYADAGREYWRRGSPTLDDWELQSVTYTYADGEIKTPYSDEKNIGLIQSLLGGQLKIQYVEKKERDAFAKERLEGSTYLLNNNGRSDHQSALISFQKSWKNHLLEVNGAWQEISTSNLDYDDVLDDEDMIETIWLKTGDKYEEIYKYERLRTDFNRPFIVNMIYNFKTPSRNFSFTNIIKFRSPYETLSTVKDENNRSIWLDSALNPDQGIGIYTGKTLVYEKVETQSSITFDWHIQWSPAIGAEKNLAFTLDVLNVFNKRSKIGYQTGISGYDYELGRQIWAGVEFNF